MKKEKQKPEEEKVERLIAFYPYLSRRLGSINNAIFYQQMFYWSDKGDRDDGFIYKTKEEIESETTLTPRMQDKCVKDLEEIGWLATKTLKVNNAPTKHYKTLFLLKLRIVTKGKIRKAQKVRLEKHKKLYSLHTETTTETTTLATDVASRKTKSPKKKPMEEVTYEPLHKPSRKKPSGARRNEPKELVLFYFHLKGFDPTIANPAMPHMSPAKQLIKASGGLKEAKAKLTFLKEKAEKDWKGADWTISTALKHFGDLKEKEPNSDLYV